MISALGRQHNICMCIYMYMYMYVYVVVRIRSLLSCGVAMTQNAQANKPVAKSSPASARRIQELEKQVQDLKNIIQKRFPNSLSAMILASAHGKSQNPEGTKVHEILCLIFQ